jgi:peptidoglycan/LPS O-acetylase OafA/YrhL
MDVARGRIDYLDGLRGIAAIAVVLQHLAERILLAAPASRSILQPAFLDLFNAGRFGVALFFLISGFVIPFSFREPRPLLRFAVSRFFRLYPAYWLSLALALLIFPSLTGESYSIARITANITMVQAAFGQRDVIGAYWTLFIELAFYGLCMGLFATRLLSDWRAVVAAIFAALAISFAVAAYASLHGSHLPANVPLNIALMFLGTLMRRAWLEQDMGAKRWVGAVSLVWAILVPPILWLTPSQPDMPITPLSFCIAYWLALGLFVAASKLKVPKGRAFVWLGIVSYSIYLFHDICIEVMLKLIPPADIWRATFFTGAVLGSSIILAALIYHLIEHPSIRIGHRLIKIVQVRALTAQVLKGAGN